MEKVTRLPLDPDRNAERRRLHLREVSEGAEPAGSVGEELRAARLRVGEDIRSVAAALKIRREHLEALEEGQIDRLPARAYAIGFVRSYAEYLGLDAAAIVVRFKEEIGAAAPEPERVEEMVFPDGQEDGRLPYGWIILFIVLMVATLWGAFYLSQSADHLLGANDAAPALQVAVETQQSADQPASTTADPALASLATKRVPPLASIPEASAPAAAAPAPMVGRLLGSTSPDSRVFIRALSDGVFVRVEDLATGEALINMKLNSGDVFRTPNRENLILVSRNAGALELIFDSRSLGPIGSQGAVLTNFSLSPTKIGERVAAQEAAAQAAAQAARDAAAAAAGGLPSPTPTAHPAVKAPMAVKPVTPVPPPAAAPPSAPIVTPEPVAPVPEGEGALSPVH